MTDFPNWFNVTAKQHFEDHVPTTPKLKVLQIGVFTGDATQWLLDNRDIELIVDVDTWAGSEEDVHSAMEFSEVESVYDSRFKENKKVSKYKMTSNAFFETLVSDKFDFIYIDGDHTATQTAIDGLNALKFLNPGGIIAFDDLAWQSGKGPYYDPKLGIEAVFHVGKSLLENFVDDSQAWFRKK